MENKNKIILALIAYLLYVAVGTMCMLVGSQMASLSSYFNSSIDKIALISSAYAIGRIGFAFFAGKLVENNKPLRIIRIGCIFMLIYLLGISTINNYYLSFVFAVAGGAGMAVQDAVCPFILSQVFPKKYSSALSASQIFYGVGTFAMSFLVGFVLRKKYYFGISNYLVSIFPIIIIVLSLFATLDKKTVENNDVIKPLYAKNTTIALLLSGLAALIYCLSGSTISLYTSSYAASIGFSAELSSNILTFFNLGVIVGSIIFCFVLKKVSEKDALLFNSIFTLIFLVLSIKCSTYILKSIFMFCVGIFNGVNFSIILAIITRIGFEHIALTSSIISIFSGAGDILAPILTGFIYNSYGINITYYSALAFLGLLLIAVLVIYFLVKEEPYGNTK